MSSLLQISLSSIVRRISRTQRMPHDVTVDFMVDFVSEFVPTATYSCSCISSPLLGGGLVQLEILSVRHRPLKGAQGIEVYGF